MPISCANIRGRQKKRKPNGNVGAIIETYSVPHKALSPCRRCGKIGCEQHAAVPWQQKSTTTPRLRGPKLQRARFELYLKQPNCEHCGRAFRNISEMIRDHVVPLAEGGAENTVNTQALCHICSDLKTQAEAQRGQRRWG